MAGWGDLYALYEHDLAVAVRKERRVREKRRTKALRRKES